MFFPFFLLLVEIIYIFNFSSFFKNAAGRLGRRPAARYYNISGVSPHYRIVNYSLPDDTW